MSHNPMRFVNFVSYIEFALSDYSPLDISLTHSAFEMSVQGLVISNIYLVTCTILIQMSDI